jgi:hypothetical protein
MRTSATGEAPWAFMSLKPESCRKLVEAKWSPSLSAKGDLLAACNLESKSSSRWTEPLQLVPTILRKAGSSRTLLKSSFRRSCFLFAGFSSTAFATAAIASAFCPIRR